MAAKENYLYAKNDTIAHIRASRFCIIGMPYLHHEHCLMLYCCKAFAYNIKACVGSVPLREQCPPFSAVSLLVEMGWRRNETDG